MGVDEALLRSAVSGRSSVRFYAWSGDWLSLGYAQECGHELAAACARTGVGWVRRLTGGRALLHGRDLCYAVAAPIAELPGSLQQVSARIGAALEAALRGLGVPAERAAPSKPAARGDVFDCFAQPAGDEIVLEGRKLVGSAQRRTREAWLQHGSICLAPHTAVARHATGLDGRAAISLEEWGMRICETDLRHALAAALETSLGVELQGAAIAPEEALEASRRGQEPPTRASVEAP